MISRKYCVLLETENRLIVRRACVEARQQPVSLRQNDRSLVVFARELLYCFE